jgi:hypothetical protein
MTLNSSKYSQSTIQLPLSQLLHPCTAKTLQEALEHMIALSQCFGKFIIDVLGAFLWIYSKILEVHA